MTNELPLSTKLDIYEAVPVDMVQETVSQQAPRKQSAYERLIRVSHGCVLTLIALWVLFTVSLAYEMGFLPKFWWQHEERVPALMYHAAASSHSSN
jgi:hypothetical protein